MQLLKRSTALHITVSNQLVNTCLCLESGSLGWQHREPLLWADPFNLVDIPVLARRMKLFLQADSPRDFHLAKVFESHQADGYLGDRNEYANRSRDGAIPGERQMATTRSVQRRILPVRFRR